MISQGKTKQINSFFILKLIYIMLIFITGIFVTQGEWLLAIAQYSLACLWLIIIWFYRTKKVIYIMDIITCVFWTATYVSFIWGYFQVLEWLI